MGPHRRHGRHLVNNDMAGAVAANHGHQRNGGVVSACCARRGSAAFCDQIKSGSTAIRSQREAAISAGSGLRQLSRRARAFGPQGDSRAYDGRSCADDLTADAVRRKRGRTCRMMAIAQAKDLRSFISGFIGCPFVWSCSTCEPSPLAEIGRDCYGRLCHWKLPFGAMVAFTECPLWINKRTFAMQEGMSALPPKADMCGATEVMSALCQ